MGGSEEVFVSKVATREWGPDPDVPGSEMHEVLHVDGLWVGLTRFETVNGPVRWTPDRREVIHVIEGRARIEVEGMRTIEVGSGDVASLPAGVPTTWHITTPFEELWVLA